MKEIIKAYDGYGDLSRDMYFSTLFNILPSKLTLRLPLKESKENFDRALSLIDFDNFNVEIVSKNWKTSDYKNTKKTEDFVCDYLYVSKKKSLLINISLEDNQLDIDFFYDSSDAIVEKWILEMNHQLRTYLGEMKTPSFKVLTRNTRGFYGEDVNTKNFETLDVNLMYNDDFKEVNAIISHAIPENKSGLILLHGKPGTGKTTYIKNLISIFSDKIFIFIQNDFVPQLLKPDFITFLLRHKDCVLIIEDAEKVVMSRESQESSVVSTILQLTDGLFSDYLNIKVICSFNTDLNKIDKALLRKGRMIARYEFKDLTVDKSNKLLESIGYGALDKAMSIAEIYKFKDKNFSKVAKKPIGFR